MLFSAEQEVAEWLLFGKQHCLSDNVQLLECNYLCVCVGGGGGEWRV